LITTGRAQESVYPYGIRLYQFLLSLTYFQICPYTINCWFYIL